MSTIAGLPPGITFDPCMLDLIDPVKGQSPAESALEYFYHQKKYPFVLIKDEDDEVVAIDGWQFVFFFPDNGYLRYDKDRQIKEIFYCVMYKNNGRTEYNYLCSQNELNKESNSNALIESALKSDLYKAFSCLSQGLGLYHCYLDHECGPKALRSACASFQSAALLIPHAAVALADIYSSGILNVAAGVEQAIDWYLHAGNHSTDTQLIIHCAERILQKQIDKGFNLLCKAAEILDPITRDKNFYGIAYLIYYFENLDVEPVESKNWLLMTARSYREQLPPHLKETSGSELIQIYGNPTGLSIKQAMLHNKQFAR